LASNPLVLSSQFSGLSSDSYEWVLTLGRQVNNILGFRFVADHERIDQHKCCVKRNKEAASSPAGSKDSSIFSLISQIQKLEQSAKQKSTDNSLENAPETSANPFSLPHYRVSKAPRTEKGG